MNARCGENGALCVACSQPVQYLAQEPPCGAPMETIVAAAIRVKVPIDYFDMGYPHKLTVSAPPPARHHTLMHPMYSVTGGAVCAGDDQGFLTSNGRFVSREEAYAIAVASGQPMIDHPSRIPGMLFSEDLW